MSVPSRVMFAFKSALSDVCPLPKERLKGLKVNQFRYVTCSFFPIFFFPLCRGEKKRGVNLQTKYYFSAKEPKSFACMNFIQNPSPHVILYSIIKTLYRL